MKQYAACCSAFLLILGIPAICLAEPAVVWQIGKFNDSSLEFRSGVPRTDPVFVVGQSDPASDWYADQPGSGSAPQPRTSTVQFALEQPPLGQYTLKLSLLASTPRLPAIEVSVNGHRGRFFQHPKVNYSNADPASRFLAIFSQVSIAFDVPPPYLRQGTNTIAFTAVDDPPGGVSRISYDALSLENDPARPFAGSAIKVDVVPTIFYKNKEGGLVEIVDVYLRHNQPLRGARVSLAIGSYHLTQDVPGATGFGEQKIRFEVPEFSATTPGQVTVTSDGGTRHFPIEVKPAKKWTLFAVPHEHLDIGYTDYPPKVAEVQSRAIDEAIDMIRDHPDFRWTLDGHWVADQFLSARSDAQRKEFLRGIREKKIFLPANWAAIYTGRVNLEGLLRSFYPSQRLNRENGGDFDHAIITDLPSHSWSYPSAMAAAGLKYLVLAANNDLGPMLTLGRPHEKSPFWWEGPDGKRILTWYSRHYLQVEGLFGMPPRLEAGHDSLPTFLQIYSRPEYKSDAAILFGTQVENTALHREQATLAADWNRVYAYPKLRFSGVAEAMQYIAGQMGESIPVVRGDGVSYWDRFANESTAPLARETDHRVLTAEKVSTIASLVNPRIWPDRQVMEQLWKGLFTYAEHHGGGGRNGSLRARHDKDLLALYNARLMEQVLARGMSALAGEVHAPSGTLIVFNSLNWRRSRLVEFNLPAGSEIVDLASNQVVPFEELPAPARGGSDRGARGRRIRFLAASVPAVGYKSYTLRASKDPVPAPAAPAPHAQASVQTIENAYYRVVLDPGTGSIRSLVDKDLGRELIDQASPYKFNQLVLANGQQSSRNSAGLSTTVAPPPEFQIDKASGGRIISVSRTPFGTVARLETSAQNTRVATEIVLFDGEKKIAITNLLQSGRGGARYFAFPLAMDRPEFRYEIQNGVVNPAKDLLPGGGREWFPVQHWAMAEQDGVAAAIVPVDTALTTFGDIIRFRWPTEFGTRKGTIFSYLARGSDQDLTFRYVFTSGRQLAPGALSRLGWDAMTPLELNEIIAQDKVGNPPRPLAGQGSFLDVDHPSAVLLAWKHAEDGNGTILRFVETGGRSGEARISSTLLKVERAWLCNSVEENQRSLKVSEGGFKLDVAPFAIVTVRVAGSLHRTTPMTTKAPEQRSDKAPPSGGAGGH